jgi:hypothetical protein
VLEHLAAAGPEMLVRDVDAAVVSGESFHRLVLDGFVDFA